MKCIKMIKPTNQFQTIIDRYYNKIRKNKPKDSLNSLFLKDLNQIKNFNNFSNDEEYMINEIKNEKKIKNDNSMKNKNKYSNFSSLSVSNEKISKDLFFYYKNKMNSKNNIDKEQIQRKKLKLNLGYNSPSNRMNSGKRSEKSFSISSVQSRNSKRKKSNASLILPLIYDRNYNYNYSKSNKKNNISLILDDDTNTNSININIKSIPQSEKKTKLSDEINFEGNNKFLNFNKRKKNRNDINTINIKDFIKNMRIEKSEKELLYKVKLPLVENDMFNKINKVTQKSENITKNINYLYSEGNIAYENEINKIKFLKDIMNE